MQSTPEAPDTAIRPPFRMVSGGGPIVATAIHSGHDLRRDVEENMVLNAADRRREEDPYTDRLTGVFATRVIVDRSRFEVDLNRPPDEAVYATADQSWGLDVWREPPSRAIVADSLAIHTDFYRQLDRLLDRLAGRGPFVVLDLHSYNHRRDGWAAPPAATTENPDVNIGTGTLDHERWDPLVRQFTEDLAARLPQTTVIAENVRFRGGYLSRRVNERYEGRGCALALEFKKTFMDEWTGELDELALRRLASALASTSEGIVRQLRGMR
jgi:N-formylglutamate deformylase